MIAINGVYAVFKVEAVMKAAGISRDGAERRQEAVRKLGRKREDVFAQVLDTVMCESGQVSEAIPTTVYGRDGRMSDIRYRSKEYHY